MLATAMTAGGSNTPADSTATSTRVDPRLEVNHREDTIDYGAYPFVKLDANRVQMNGDDWTALAAKFAGAAAGDSILGLSIWATRTSRPTSAAMSCASV